MSKFVFKPAVKEAAPIIAGLYGPSGSGKTLSALLLARGLVGPKGRIALINTETKRGGIYADHAQVGGYLLGEIVEPFAPEKFKDAVVAAEEIGADAIVVDSFSHEWEGDGGVVSMRDEAALKSKPGSQEGLHHWIRPKKEHKAAIRRMIRTPAHLILCMRGEAKTKMVKDQGRDVPTEGPILPIQDKRLGYELTFHLRMLGGGRFEATKCPEPLLSIFANGGQVSVEMGRKLAAWASEGTAVGNRRLAANAQEAANLGSQALERHLTGLTETERRELAPDLEALRGNAATVDQEEAAMTASVEAEVGFPAQGERSAAPFDPGAPPRMSAAKEAEIIESGLADMIAETEAGEIRAWWAERASSINRLKLIDPAAYARIEALARAKSKEAA